MDPRPLDDQLNRLGVDSLGSTDLVYPLVDFFKRSLYLVGDLENQMKTQKEWAEFGKRVYDTSVNHLIDSPGVQKVVIPLITKDGDLATFTVGDFVSCVEFYWDGEERKSRHGYRLSDGSIRWKK